MMQGKKDIDRLFQEKFKDFEAQPDPEVWDAIDKKLSKKKKRRPLVLWFRVAGVAAILLLLFTLGSQFFGDPKEDIPENIIVNSADKNDDPSKQTVKETIDIIEEPLITDDQSIAKNVDNTNKQKGENKEIPKVNNPKLNIAQNNEIKNEVTEREIIDNSEEKRIDIPLHKKEVNEKNNIIESNDTKLALAETKEEKGKISIEDALANNEDQEDPEKEKILTDRFSVGTSYSPIYYASLSEGSPIDESISGNSNTAQLSSSYGVKVAYKINDKWSIQTGLHNVDLNHMTKYVTVDVIDASIARNSDDFSNLVLGEEMTRMNITPQGSNLNSTPSVLSASGDMRQSIGYLEVPVEVKYNVIDEKVDIQLMGGFSTLFLTNNEVLLNNNISTFILGEASNLNEVNYSLNLGMDLDYNLSEKWFINVSPSLKYHLNTFSENSGGFKPYLISLNTGLNFRF